MPKSFRLGKMNIETRSMLIGVAFAMVGLSIPQTQSFFKKILETVNSAVSSVFKKK